MNNNKVEKFSLTKVHKKNLLVSTWSLILKSVFTFLSKRSLNFYCNPCDKISFDPILFGHHEKYLNTIFQNLGSSGYNQFFIDVGANIGLSSIQNNNSFKKYYLIEPNPICYNILKANLLLHFEQNNYSIYPYAISSSEGNTVLRIPRGNFGGGFLTDKINELSPSELLHKDGFKSYNSKNYLELDVSCKTGDKIFKDIFCDIIENNLKSGLIKIDVEGCEPEVLKAISKQMPENHECAIIFENWNSRFGLKDLQKIFHRGIEVFLIKDSFNDENSTKLAKVCRILKQNGYYKEIVKANASMKMNGEILCIL